MDGRLLLSAFYFVVFMPALTFRSSVTVVALHTPLAGFGIVEALALATFFCTACLGLLAFILAVYTRGFFLIIPLYCICFVTFNNFLLSRRCFPSPCGGSCYLFCTVHREK